MRLPSALRMKASREFARVRKEGTSQAGRFLVLSVLKEPSIPEFHFGLITSRKLGTAVTRNRIRRRLREVIRAQRDSISPGWMFVVIARWRAPEASLEDLRKDWQRLARKAGLLQPPPPKHAAPS